MYVGEWLKDSAKCGVFIKLILKYIMDVPEVDDIGLVDVNDVKQEQKYSIPAVQGIIQKQCKLINPDAVLESTIKEIRENVNEIDRVKSIGEVENYIFNRTNYQKKT